MSLGTTTKAWRSPWRRTNPKICRAAPLRLDREVVPGGKESWVRAAAIEGQRGDVELNTPVFLAPEELLRQGGPVVPGGRQPRLQLLQQAVPVGIVHRTPVIRIDQAKIPELRALIRIGDPRGGDLQEGLGERVEQAQVAQAPLQAPEIVEKAVFVWASRIVAT